MHILKIEHLTVSVNDKLILNDFSLEIKSGEIHAIMGPNGTGKSTLSKVIMGDPTYKIINGSIYYDDVLLNDLTTDERARLGIFLGMQMPLELEGVTNADFLRTALHIKEGTNFKLFNFIKKLDNTIEKLHMHKDIVHRVVNKDFSGGERKKNEILQMYLLEPNMVILDEIDSGLDVDSLKIVGDTVMEYYHQEKLGILLITHYQRLLDYIKPDFVHIMINGKIVKSGDSSLVSKIEESGYNQLINENN
ncbi:MAG: Fe-S cluster assembly ATPase SufC [Mollicutes bacterium]|jgi:Fe-S cluster assembly ATP-binding protein|nr:Fe-S cluster assembly ATPase SufC [Mollicutes bacterium]